MPSVTGALSERAGRLGVMVEMNPVQARVFWKALMHNASALVADAQMLLAAESYGRAKSLTVLAQEELGKALWVYDTFESAWSQGDETSRTVDVLAQHGRSHTKKYLAAFVFGDELAAFWGAYCSLADFESKGESWQDAYRRRQNEAEVAAVEANLAKQRGFYVDRDGTGAVSCPTDIDAGNTAADLQTVAQIVEMLLIRDHSRMKFEAATPYDSTHAQQFRLLPISHPDDWAAASEEFRSGPRHAGHRSDDDDDRWHRRV